MEGRIWKVTEKGNHFTFLAVASSNLSAASSFFLAAHTGRSKIESGLIELGMQHLVPNGSIY